MKRKLYIAATLLIVALIVQGFFADSGYVAVHVGQTLLETSLPGGVLVLIVLYFAVRAVIKIIRAPALMRLAAENRRRERARRSLVQG